MATTHMFKAAAFKPTSGGRHQAFKTTCSAAGPDRRSVLLGIAGKGRQEGHVGGHVESNPPTAALGSRPSGTAALPCLRPICTVPPAGAAVALPLTAVQPPPAAAINTTQVIKANNLSFIQASQSPQPPAAVSCSCLLYSAPQRPACRALRRRRR